MTTQSSFKRLVRARMEKTGERYTAARAMLLAGQERNGDGAGGATAAPVLDSVRLATSDAEIRRRTGRGWEEWFDLLDEAGAADRSHRDNARWVADLQGVVPLAWNAQAVVGGYEQARGLRASGEHADGFSATASKTVAVDVEALYDAFVEPSRRASWLPDGELRERTATRPLRARFDWGEDGSRVHVTFTAKGDGKSALALDHRRLADAAAGERMKAYWRTRLAALKAQLER